MCAWQVLFAVLQSPVHVVVLLEPVHSAPHWLVEHETDGTVPVPLICQSAVSTRKSCCGKRSLKSVTSDEMSPHAPTTSATRARSVRDRPIPDASARSITSRAERPPLGRWPRDFGHDLIGDTVGATASRGHIGGQRLQPPTRGDD